MLSPIALRSILAGYFRSDQEPHSLNRLVLLAVLLHLVRRQSTGQVLAISSRKSRAVGFAPTDLHAYGLAHYAFQRPARPLCLAGPALPQSSQSPPVLVASHNLVSRKQRQVRFYSKSRKTASHKAGQPPRQHGQRPHPPARLFRSARHSGCHFPFVVYKHPMSTYIAVTVRSPRKKAYWLGRMTLDGEVSLIAEFTTHHNLKVVLAALKGVPLKEPVMDPQQPQKIDFSTFKGEKHPDSVRAYEERWKPHGEVHAPDGPGEPAPDQGAVGGPADAERSPPGTGDGLDPDGDRGVHQG